MGMLADVLLLSMQLKRYRLRRRGRPLCCCFRPSASIWLQDLPDLWISLLAKDEASGARSAMYSLLQPRGISKPLPSAVASRLYEGSNVAELSIGGIGDTKFVERSELGIYRLLRLE